MKRNFNRSDKGQTLIEAIVTIGIALIIIGSIVTLVNRSNARATNARQATQASKLAQEGLEIIRNIKDINYSVAIRTGPCTATPCAWSGLYGGAVGVVSARLREPGILAEQCGFTDSWCLDDDDPGDPETLLTIFTRTVEISDDTISGGGICADSSPLNASQVKRVTVKVAWDSPVGRQERTVVSCLTNRI